MHQVRLDHTWDLGEGSFSKLRLNSPAGGWFPVLQDLQWSIAKSNLPHVDLFLSPHLKKISVHPPSSWYRHGIPRDVMSAIASTISALPTSALQCLRVFSWGSWSLRTYRADFRDSISSLVLRCGPSLMEFGSTVPLSDAAVDHLIRLPHLHTCRIEGPPPSYSASHLPLVFSPLTELVLGEDTAYEWLSALGHLGGYVGPLSKVRGSLKSLSLPGPTLDASYIKKRRRSLESPNLPCPTIDASFASWIQIFHSLVYISIDHNCKHQCHFELNNDNVTELAMALPQLESLSLGHPCPNNTCTTTVACLLSLSVHCIKLRSLEIHFDTTNITDDLRSIPSDPQFQELRSRPRCKLSFLDVHQMRLAIGELDLETVVNGMIDIFPFLGHCSVLACGAGWEELSERLKEIQDNTGRE